MDNVTNLLKNHYQNCFLNHGASAQGVDWRDQETADIRYKNMLNVVSAELAKKSLSLLDIGCGYGGLQDYISKLNFPIEYTGIDVVATMIEHATSHHGKGQYFHGDVFTYPFGRTFDYVVCNGILTQKLTATDEEMNSYMNKLIHTMFGLCNKGIAFNLMTNKVNFKAENLFYKSPVETLDFCLENISRKVIIDHSYPMYEYTVYIYKENITL